MMDQDKQVQFFPFHALNEFMRDDFRLDVLRSVMAGMPKLSKPVGSGLNRMVKKLVQVPGFRNSSLAPAAIKAKSAVSAFEKSPPFAGLVLAAWLELHPELGAKMHALLEARGWKVLPLEADRTKMPGFMIQWPQEDEFDVIYAAFREANPYMEVSDDDLGLMAVWISGRLPYENVEKAALFKDEAED
jgi:hypothetical protein